ncbi:hypothetical protein SYNTR_1054 [Candidatus Syntrophocurvum alkaliphilum]|uniref:Cytoskeleton protein RodZ-like C-terminal domain-containing protein n=1 Tax=Candidatus Syntrophocurvum alkaliphilum TaxID=2293317 RepID=A0A6I6DEU2_9FIRM|nr:helix-turn-helix domain-containing protein [Candidatus Syntrophocurvum alkaliphilum]QGT99647.1 hypothetical protein SYNTR_1054 [Candidatus Syntrophocurvum alkaliphilum]
MADIGDKFRKERLSKGYTLEAIEEETKIRKHYLDSIENEEFENLPPKVYAVGFVKRYAKFLDLDPQEMAEEFLQIAYDNTPNEEVLAQISKPNEEKPISYFSKINYKNILAGLIFLFIAIFLGNILVGYFLDKGFGERTEQPPQVVDPRDPVEKEKEITDVEEEATVSLLIEASERCWLEIVVDGEQKFSGVLNIGEEIFYEGEEEIFIHAGNAGGINLTLNGEKLEPIGESWQPEKLTFTAD